jgi:hypothetical protein
MTDSTDPTDAIDEAVDDPDGVEEYAFAGWAAQNGEGLSDFLEEMSSVYHTDNDRRWLGGHESHRRDDQPIYADGVRRAGRRREHPADH